MGLTSILLLNGQLILAADLSQGYNSAVLRDEAGDVQGMHMSVVQPRARARLNFGRSDYFLDYTGGFTFFDFATSDSELSHRGELRGNWQLGESSTADAFEQVTYGTDNTLRQMDLARVSSPEINATRLHYLMNNGRTGYHYEAGETTQLDVGLQYLLRRTVDGVSSDDPVVGFDSLVPEGEVGILQALNDDNQIGLRLSYAHYFSPELPGGSYFANAGRYSTNGTLIYNHRFQDWWTATVQAGGVYAKSLNPEFDDSYFGPTAGVASQFRGPRLTARIRYEHGYGSYGVSGAGSAIHDMALADAGFYPNPLRDDFNFYAEADARRSTEVLGDLGLVNESLGAVARIRYRIDDYLLIYSSYEWRFQRLTGTPGGEDDVAIRRHVVTIGVIGEYATPRELDVGATDRLADVGR